MSDISPNERVGTDQKHEHERRQQQQSDSHGRVGKSAADNPKSNNLFVASSIPLASNLETRKIKSISDETDTNCLSAKRAQSEIENDTTRNENDNPRSTQSTIYVSNLHPRIAEAHLQKLFGAYGSIVRIHMVRIQNSNQGRGRGNGRGDGRNNSSSNSNSSGRHGNTGRSRRPFTYAFIQFQSSVSAQMAIEKVHNKPLLNLNLIVRYSNNNNYDSSATCSTFMDGDGKRHACGDTDPDARGRLLKRQKQDVSKKIEAVKRALALKKKDSQGT